MDNYKRIFGAGPKGLIISVVLFCIALLAAMGIRLPIVENFSVRVSIFAVLALASLLLIIWSVKSLTPEMRGKTLITTGAFKYFRHPLYAAFLTFFDFGLAVLLNSWLFIIWAILLHPIWHRIIAKEEGMLKDIFPGQYEDYCNKTGRFIPRYFFR